MQLRHEGREGREGREGQRASDVALKLTSFVDVLAPAAGQLRPAGSGEPACFRPIWRYNYTMTQLLERAFAAASKLPEPEQDAFASLLLAELGSEHVWAAAFAASQDQLSALADEALGEFNAGETQPMDLESDFPNR